MENQLIQLYVLVCHVHDTQPKTCFQRLSNNSRPLFTDQEIVTIYLFGHLQGLFEKKAMHKLINNYWRHFFPHLPAYQTFVARLNQLEQTFQSIGGYFQELLEPQHIPEVDHLIDSLPASVSEGRSRLCRQSCPRTGGCRLLCQQENLFSRTALAHNRAKTFRHPPIA